MNNCLCPIPAFLREWRRFISRESGNEKGRESRVPGKREPGNENSSSKSVSCSCSFYAEIFRGCHRKQLNLALVFCVVVIFFWLVSACFCCVQLSFSIPSHLWICTPLFTCGKKNNPGSLNKNVSHCSWDYWRQLIAEKWLFSFSRYSSYILQGRWTTAKFHTSGIPLDPENISFSCPK